jgi:hypothetical protein
MKFLLTNPSKYGSIESIEYCFFGWFHLADWTSKAEPAQEGIFMAVTAKIEGNKLIITADLETPTPSASGKTLVVASTRGNKATDVMIDGKPVIIGLNAYIKK